MPEYRVTFGSQYGAAEFGADPHPVGGYDHVHRDGYWTIVATDEDAARALVLAVLGTGWSNLYSPDEWLVNGHTWSLTFPRGELLRLTHPAMADQPVALLEGPLPDLVYGPDDAPVPGTRLLVTVWGNGSGEAATRPTDDTHVTWGPPSVLTHRMA